MTVLSVRDLSVTFATTRGARRAVDGVSFDIEEGETLALVGESGSGKSSVALAIMRLIGPPAARINGTGILLNGRDVLAMDGDELRNARGKEMAMVFQDATSALNPVMSVGRQIQESLSAHGGGRKSDVRRRTVELLEMVAIPRAAERVNDLPRQLSGGMRQRVMIAMAMSCRPQLLLADEPTTALDVTVQARVLDLLRTLTRDEGSASLFITHDLAVASEIAQSVCVMYGGQVVEMASISDIFERPMMPYTWGLLQSIPQVDHPAGARLAAIPGSPPSGEAAGSGCRFAPRCRYKRPICDTKMPDLLPISVGPSAVHHVRCWGTQPVDGGGWLTGDEWRADSRPDAPRRHVARDILDLHRIDLPIGGGVTSQAPAPLLEVRDLHVHYRGRAFLPFQRPPHDVYAVRAASLAVQSGHSYGLVGETGSGKSSIGRCIARLVTPTAGKILLQGKSIVGTVGAEASSVSRRIQIIFQDPYSSLDPRMTIRRILEEPLAIHGEMADADQRVSDMLRKVGLGVRLTEQFPHELSGGQRQRVGVARALMLAPAFIVADEPTSSLDVSVQAQILNLLQDLQDEFNLTYLLISHNLAVIRHMTTDVGVMYGGTVVESGSTEGVFLRPAHPYTVALISANPRIDGHSAQGHALLKYDVMSPTDAHGCNYRSRCWLYERLGRPVRCVEEAPQARRLTNAQNVACHFAEALPEQVSKELQGR